VRRFCFPLDKNGREAGEDSPGRYIRAIGLESNVRTYPLLYYVHTKGFKGNSTDLLGKINPPTLDKASLEKWWSPYTETDIPTAHSISGQKEQYLQGRLIRLPFAGNPPSVL